MDAYTYFARYFFIESASQKAKVMFATIRSQMTLAWSEQIFLTFIYIQLVYDFPKHPIN